MKTNKIFLAVFFLILPCCIQAKEKWVLKSEFEIQADWIRPLDLNDDGVDEIMVTFGYINLIEDQRGNILRQINLADRKFRYVDAVELDGKPFKEPIFQVWYKETMYVYTIFNNGIWERIKVASGKDIRPPKGWDCGISQVGTADLNKDGFDDFLCFLTTGFDLQPRGVWVYDYHKKRELWHFWIGGHPCSKDGFTKNYYLKDIDGDGDNEIILGTSAPCNGSFANDIDDFHSYVIVLNNEGNLVWKRQIGDASTFAVIWAGDVDTDGQVEVVVVEESGLADNKEPNSLLILNGGTGEIERYIKTGEKFFGMEVCDFNRDGKLEIITGNSDGKIRIFDNSLNLIQETSFLTSVNILLTCDFDGNGTTELLVSTRDCRVFILNERLETIAEEQILQGLTGIHAFIISSGKTKKILFKTGNKSPLTYKLMSVVPVVTLPARIPRFFFIFITCFIILIGVVGVSNYIMSTRRIRRVKKAVDLFPYGVILIDSKDQIIFINTSAIRIFHKGNVTLLKEPVNTLISGENLKPMLEWLANPNNQRIFKFNIESNEEAKEFEASLYPINGERLIIVEDKTTKYTSERIISWAGFAQRLAHEIKNPLSTITLTLQRLQRIYRDKLGKESKKLDSYTNSILEEIERLRYTTDRFMRILSLEKPIFEPDDINSIIDNSLEKYEKSLPEKVKIKKSFDKNVPLIKCDRNQIMVLLSNLIENALEAMKGVGTLSIKTSLIEKILDKKIKKFVELNLEDTGEGISENNLKNLFKPFYSTKDGGTGLGLLISQQIVKVHKGKIEIRSKRGIGTVSTIILPIKENST